MTKGMPPSRTATLLSAVMVYARARVLIVMLLGFAAGLPLALSGSTLAIWLADRKVDLATIGLLSLAGLPYTLKFLWAPIVDALDVPLLTARLGRRRAWLLSAQLVLMAAILWLGAQDPVAAPAAVGVGALLVAAASATQDIVIDAFRVESLKPDEQAAGMASYVAAYRAALLVSGAGAIALASWLEAEGVDKARVWGLAYAGCALLGVVGILATLLAGRDAGARAPDAAAAGEPAPRAGILARVLRTAEGALRAFLSREGAALALAFVVLFKLCDALAGAMTGPFVLAVGYDKATYAGIVKGVGFFALLGGGFLGGMIANAITLRPALWLALVLQMVSNLAFTWLALRPVSALDLTAVVLIENVTGAIGTVIFIAYLSALCETPAHTATQYALLTALASTGRTLLSSGTGYAANALGWPWFFVATALAALPSLALMVMLEARGHFAALAAPAVVRDGAD